MNVTSRQITPEEKVLFKQRRALAVLSYSIDPLILWVYAQAKKFSNSVAAKQWLQEALTWRDNTSITKQVDLPHLEAAARALFSETPAADVLDYLAFGEDIPRREIEAYIKTT